MRLYYAPGACSQAVHIALRECGVPFETEKVDLASKKTERGDDYLQTNPKGYVPALELDDGQVLTEVSAVLQYVADLQPDKRLTMAAGTMERYRLVEWLGFISTELHKQFAPFFKGGSDEEKKRHTELISRRLGYVEERLGDGYLMGSFSVADAYLLVVTRWAVMNGIGLAPWPNLRAWKARMEARPAVARVLDDEGFGKKAKVA